MPFMFLASDAKALDKIISSQINGLQLGPWPRGGTQAHSARRRQPLRANGFQVERCARAYSETRSRPASNRAAVDLASVATAAFRVI